MIDKQEIEQLTMEYSGEWGINHSKRLLHLVSMLSEGLDYNEEAVWMAAYLHDWGGYQPWVTPGVEHYVRSTEVAREFLQQRDCPPELMNLVLECISCHHGGPADRSIESKLLTDADALDLLGVVGTMRICCLVPRDLGGAYAAVKKYRDLETAAISLDKTRQMAAIRIKETDDMLARFEEETFGMF